MRNTYRVNFSTVPTQFQKTANQPITAFLITKIYWNSSCDWLISDFLFGTEIGWDKLKSPPCISTTPKDFLPFIASVSQLTCNFSTCSKDGGLPSWIFSSRSFVVFTRHSVYVFRISYLAVFSYLPSRSVFVWGIFAPAPRLGFLNIFLLISLSKALSALSHPCE